MSLIIDDPATEALARELARRDGVTPAQAIARALKRTLEAPAAAPNAPTDEQRRAALDRLAALREDIARSLPATAEPIPWETVKRWAEDEEDEAPPAPTR